MKEKEKIKEMLKRNDIVIIITLKGFGKNAEIGVFPFYNFYILIKEKNGFDGSILEKLTSDDVTFFKVEGGEYWSKRKGAYKMNLLGGNRIFELIYSIARNVFENFSPSEILSIANSLYSKTICLI